MDEKKVDLLIAKADLYKLLFLAFGGYFILELFVTGESVEHVVKLLGSMLLMITFFSAMIYTWDKAEKITKGNSK